MTSACVGSESLFYGMWRTTSRRIRVCVPRAREIKPSRLGSHLPAAAVGPCASRSPASTRTALLTLPSHAPMPAGCTGRAASAQLEKDKRGNAPAPCRTRMHVQNTDAELEAPVHAHQPALGSSPGGPPSSILVEASAPSGPCSFLLLPLLRGPNLGSLLNSCSKHSLWWPDSHVCQPAFADHRMGMGALAAGGRWATREREDRKQEKALSRPQRPGCTGRIHSERTIQACPSTAYHGILGEGRRATVHPAGKTGKGKAQPAGPPPAGRAGAPLRGLCRR